MIIRHIKREPEDTLFSFIPARLHTCRCFLCAMHHNEESTFSITIGSYTMDISLGTWRAQHIDCDVEHLRILRLSRRRRYPH